MVHVLAVTLQIIIHNHVSLYAQDQPLLIILAFRVIRSVKISVMMVGLEYERIQQCLNILNEQQRGDFRLLQLVSDYSQLNVSEKVVRILHSYTDYINRVVWKKY